METFIVSELEGQEEDTEYQFISDCSILVNEGLLLSQIVSVIQNAHLFRIKHRSSYIISALN